MSQKYGLREVLRDGFNLAVDNITSPVRTMRHSFQTRRYPDEGNFRPAVRALEVYARTQSPTIFWSVLCAAHKLQAINLPDANLVKGVIALGIFSFIYGNYTADDVKGIVYPDYTSFPRFRAGRV